MPELVAYHSIKVILNIMNVKQNEKKKEIEKAERDGKKVTFVDPNVVEEEKKMTTTEE